MGRGNAFIGNFRGKVGNIVGYTIKNSSKKDTQGLRVYQPIVKNPKTVAQSNQRMIVAASSVFYSHFSEILDHSFEGLTEGAKNQERFMKLALTQKQAPYVDKGTAYLVPGIYQISEGGLTATPTEFKADGNKNSETYSKIVPHATGLKLTADNKNNLALFLQDNPMFKEGDQLTYVLFMRLSTADGERYYYILGRGWLNEVSERKSPTGKSISAFADSQASLNGITVMEDTTDSRLMFFHDADDTAEIVAAGLIVSRWQNNKWMRNNCTLAVSDAFFDTWYSDERWDAALKTYQASNESASTSDLYLNQDGNIKVVKLTVMSILTTGSGTPARFACAIDDQGRKFLFANPDKLLYGADWKKVVKTEGETPVYWSTSDVDMQYITGTSRKPELPLYVEQDKLHPSDGATSTFGHAAASKSRNIKSYATRLSEIEPKPVPVEDDDRTDDVLEHIKDDITKLEKKSAASKKKDS